MTVIIKLTKFSQLSDKGLTPIKTATPYNKKKAESKKFQATLD